MKYKLVLFDVDSTLTRTEGIDLLAEYSPHAAKVAEITERAMHGEIDFDTAIQERVSLLTGLKLDVIDRAIERSEVSVGAKETVFSLKERGLKVGIVSGGFREIIDEVFKDWPFDIVVAHQLKKDAGTLSGYIDGPIINRAMKAQVLRDFALRSQVELDETIAVGDGSNDIEMIELAGLGISYNGKPALNKVADLQIHDLREIINLI